MATSLLPVSLCAVLALACAPVSAQEGGEEFSPPTVDIEDEETLEDDAYIFLQAESHVSLISDAPDRSVFAASRGGGIRGGYRWTRWGLFGHIEQNRWLTSEVDSTLTDGVLNIGVGADYRLYQDRIRTSAAVGTSTLLFDTFLDEAGATGYFVDLRPGGFRWSPLEWLTLEFHPLSYTLMVPVVTSPQIVHIEYRTAFITEFRL